MSQSNNSAAKIQLLATGGTIASRFAEATQDFRVHSRGSDLAATALSRIPSVEVVIEDAMNIASFEMDLDMSFGLARRIDTCLMRPDIGGVVVTHGTDTLEESAFLADLLIDSEKPVVFTGAQRAADDPDSDGPRNLADSIAVASSANAIGNGTFVVFDGQIHFARDVAKTHASRLGAFDSPDLGKAGEVDAGNVLLYRRSADRHVFRHWKLDSRVDLIKLAQGADGRFVDCSVASGARGIVLEAFGRGNVTPKVFDAVRRAVAANVSVIVTSRCGQGRVAPIYGGSGGASLARAGALFGGRLTGVKARVLLAVLLGQYSEAADIEKGLRRLGA